MSSFTIQPGRGGTTLLPLSQGTCPLRIPAPTTPQFSELVIWGTVESGTIGSRESFRLRLKHVRLCSSELRQEMTGHLGIHSHEPALPATFLMYVCIHTLLFISINRDGNLEKWRCLWLCFSRESQFRTAERGSTREKDEMCHFI